MAGSSRCAYFNILTGPREAARHAHQQIADIHAESPAWVSPVGTLCSHYMRRSLVQQCHALRKAMEAIQHREPELQLGKLGYMRCPASRSSRIGLYLRISLNGSKLSVQNKQPMGAWQISAGKRPGSWSPQLCIKSRQLRVSSRVLRSSHTAAPALK